MGRLPYDDALADLKRILSEEDLSARVELIEIESFEQSSERFPARRPSASAARTSPPGDGEPFTLTCRIYRLRDGRISPTPGSRGRARRGAARQEDT